MLSDQDKKFLTAIARRSDYLLKTVSELQAKMAGIERGTIVMEHPERKEKFLRDFRTLMELYQIKNVAIVWKRS